MRLRTAASVFVTSLLVLSGCSLGGESEGKADKTEDHATEDTQSTQPAVDDSGFFSDPKLAGIGTVDFNVPAFGADGSVEAKSRARILSLDKNGDTVRMVGAWLRSSEGASLGSETLAVGRKAFHRGPWIRLVDEAGGKLYEPLQEAGAEAGSFDRKDACLCSEAKSRTFFEPREGNVELFWVDFPAPESSDVRVLMGEHAVPTEALPISTDTPFENPIPEKAAFEEDPPDEYGSADAQRAVLPLRENIKNIAGSRQTQADDQLQLSVTSDVLFDFDSSTITSEGKKVLDDAAKTLRESAEGQTVTIVGHTDDQGDEAYNQKLSEERARAVEEALKKPLEGANITLKTEGRGEKEPLSPNKDSEGKPIEENRKQNRRVSFDYTPKEGADTKIDTGEKLPDAPKMEETETAEGAAASAILKQPGMSTGGKDLRIDLRGLKADGKFARLDYAFALPDENAQPVAGLFVGTEQVTRFLHFGLNPYSYAGAPSGANVSLTDEETGEQFLPVTGGDADCLCTEGASTVEGAFAEPSQMFSMFPAEVLEREKLTLRIANSGTWPLTVDEISSGGQE